MQNKSQCCGCGACMNACKRKAIVMQEDKEGFLYPQVNKALCNNCNLCKRVCPFLNPHVTKIDDVNIYCAKNKNLYQRINSSSGGIFPIIAYRLFKKGFIVAGAVFDKKWNVVHQIVESKEDIPKLFRSKYVQSNTLNIFKDVKRRLDLGEKVLFSGTPCQSFALKLFLRKKYPNLFVVDIICHGVPSPMVWQKYLQEKSEDYGETKENISQVNFKIKDSSKKYYWRRPGFNILWKSGSEFSSFGNATSYENGFLTNLFVRPSCHNCKIKGISSGSDVTIGDFWGCDVVKPNFEDSNGVSLIFVNTEKGRKLFEEIQCELFFSALDKEEAILHNNKIIICGGAHVNRKKFFKQIDKRLDRLVPELVKVNRFQKMMLRLKLSFNKHLRNK